MTFVVDFVYNLPSNLQNIRSLCQGRKRQRIAEIDWDFFPVELLKKILSHLDTNNHFAASRVCKAWRRAAFTLGLKMPYLVDIRTAPEYVGLSDREKRVASHKLQMIASLMGGWKKLGDLPRWSERVGTWPRYVFDGRVSTVPLNHYTIKPSDLPTPIVIGETACGTPLIIFRQINLFTLQPGVCSLKKLRYGNGWSLTEGPHYQEISHEIFVQSIDCLKYIFATPPATPESINDPTLLSQLLVRSSVFPFLLWDGPDSINLPLQ